MNNNDNMQNNFSPLYKGEREGVAGVALTPPNLPSYEGRKYAGFTLIELMIAVGIFGVFLAILTGVFSNFVQSERRNIAQSSLITDVQSAMESFAKEVRTGYGSTYFGDGDAVAFRNQAGICVIYRLEKEGEIHIFKRAEDPSKSTDADKDCDPNDDDGYQFVPLTSNQTDVAEVDITATPAIFDSGTGNQGTVEIIFTAKAAHVDLADIEIQRTITSRQFSAYNPDNL